MATAAWAWPPPRGLSPKGAYVFITGRRQAELDAAVKLIGENVTGVQGDVSNLADLDRLYATVKEKKGRIDVLFANAGVASYGRLGEITEEHFDGIFNINVRGLLFSVQKALPLFQDGGSIILNASIASIKGMEALGVYSASKAAVRSFARCWTSDLKGRKIRVNTLSPGPIDTPILDVLTEEGTPAGQVELRRASPDGDGWGPPTRSRKSPCSSPPTTAASSRASICSSTAGWPRSEAGLDDPMDDRGISPARPSVIVSLAMRGAIVEGRS